MSNIQENSKASEHTELWSVSSSVYSTEVQTASAADERWSILRNCNPSNSKKMHNIKGKVKVMLICIVSIHETSVRHSGIARIAKGYQFYLHTLRFIRMPYMSLPSQPQLVLIYRPWRDGRLSRPWCGVAPAEIRTGLQVRHPTTQPLSTKRTNTNC